MQRIASLLVGGAVLAGHLHAAGAAPCPPLVTWLPPADAEVVARAREGLLREAKARGCRLVTALAPTVTPPPSLAGDLAAAIADYRGFKFADAAEALDRLAQAAQARGGDELDARQLGELFLYRALAANELGRTDAAWDDFVRAARLDPARVLDPAQFPPRAVAAYRRAAADALQLPRATVRLTLPSGARAWLDGREVDGPVDAALGTHLLRVRAEGYEPWGGAVDVTMTEERITPPLVPLRAPPQEKLVALAGGPPALVAVVERAAPGWRLSLTAVAADGTARALERSIDAETAGAAPASLLHQLLDAPAPLALVPPSGVTATAPSPGRKRLPAWGWGLIGGAIATIAVVVPLAVVYGQPAPPGTIGGTIGPLK